MSHFVMSALFVLWSHGCYKNKQKQYFGDVSVLMTYVKVTGPAVTPAVHVTLNKLPPIPPPKQLHGPQQFSSTFCAPNTPLPSGPDSLRLVLLDIFQEYVLFINFQNVQHKAAPPHTHTHTWQQCNFSVSSVSPSSPHSILRHHNASRDDPAYSEGNLGHTGQQFPPELRGANK